MVDQTPSATEPAAPQEGKVRAPGELLFCLLLLMGSAVLFHQAWTISGPASPSAPRVFPMLAAGTMLASGAVIVLNTFRTPRRYQGNPITGFFTEVFAPKILFVALLIAAYLLALEPLGFVLSSFLFLAIAMSGLLRRNYLGTVLLSAAAVAVIYALFRLVFMVVLPRGIFL